MLRSTGDLASNFLTPFWMLFIFLPTFSNTISGYGHFFLPGLQVMFGFIEGRAATFQIYIDRITGEQENLFALPVPRYAIVLVRSLGAVIRGAVAAVIIALLGTFVGVSPTLESVFLGALGAALVAAITTAAMVAVASLIRKPSQLNFVSNGLSMPLMMASTIYYPLESVPHVFRGLARVNPLTIAGDLARGVNGAWHTPFLILCVLLTLALYSAARLYPRSIENS